MFKRPFSGSSDPYGYNTTFTLYFTVISPILQIKPYVMLIRTGDLQGYSTPLRASTISMVFTLPENIKLTPIETIKVPHIEMI